MHSNIQLLSAILRGTWLMDQQDAMAYFPLIEQLLQGKEIVLPESLNPAKPVSAAARPSAMLMAGTVGAFDDFDLAEPGSVAITRVQGAMMKNDYCWTPGTASIGRQLQLADQHFNIGAHVLVADSPGGHVDGTENFSRIIASGIQKPLVTFVDGQMCSACYWAGSGGDAIVAGGKTAQIGSIGTMISLTDIRNYYEKMGMKFHDIFASASKDKNQTYFQALKGNYTPMQQQLLNPINEVFLNSVKENRKDELDLKKENVLTGKVYLAEEAMEYGLIDSIGTLEEAVAMAQDMARINYKKRKK